MLKFFFYISIIMRKSSPKLLNKKNIGRKNYLGMRIFPQYYMPAISNYASYALCFLSEHLHFVVLTRFYFTMMLN